MKIGWVGNYKRELKQFDVAQRVAQQMEQPLLVAGVKDSALYIERSQMPNYYNTIDILLVTSNYEAHPLIVYEALACGTPVVMHKDTGDCFSYGLEGVVWYDEFRIDKIITAVEYAYENREDLGRKGTAHINEHWTWDKVKHQYINMFESVARKENPKVLIAINEFNWSWDFMAKEIQKYVYPVDIYYCNEEERMSDFPWDDYDIIYNHVWFKVNEFWWSDYPTHKDILALNGPAHESAVNQMTFYRLVDRVAALSTVAPQIQRKVQVDIGVKVWLATRGIDVDVFKPL